MDLSSRTAFPLWWIYVCIPDISLLDIISTIRYSRYVSDDLFSCCPPSPLPPLVADGQKRKKSLRRKLDSLAKEKSKDKGTPSSFNHAGSPSLSSFTVSLSRLLTSLSLSLSAPRAGEQRGYKNTVSVYRALTVYI